MSWGDPMVRLLVTEDCRAKAIVRYELTQLECQLRRRKSFRNSCDLKATDRNAPEAFVRQPIDLVYDPIDDASLLSWIEKMFEAFASSCPIAGLNATEAMTGEQPRPTSAIKINELFKLISEAQRDPTSYDKNG